MNVKRTVMIGVAVGAVAVWIAAAATSNTRTIAPVVPAKPNVIDKSGVIRLIYSAQLAWDSHVRQALEALSASR